MQTLGLTRPTAGIRSLSDQLTQASNALGQQLYQSQQQAGAQGQAGATGRDDEAVECSYEEI